jgi:hypothetical protein
MYEYIDDVVVLINEMIEEYIIPPKNRSFYIGRIKNFFIEYMDSDANRLRPLNALTYFDVDAHLESVVSSDSEKLNVYYALKRFFLYTYRRSLTTHFMLDVTKPVVIPEAQVYISDEDYASLTNYIYNREKDVRERLTIGLFLFTGLSRKFIYNVHSDDFQYVDGLYKLKVWKAEEEVILPIKAELQLIIYEFLSVNEGVKSVRITDKSENYFSTVLKQLCERVCGTGYTPTHFSNTFIRNALKSGNYIWEVSKLTLEGTSTIEKHISSEAGIELRQLSILNGF